MRGCLFTLALGAVVLALVVVLGLPAVASGVLTAGVTAAGLHADDTRVDVSSDPPTEIVGLHADRVRVRATDATFRDLTIERVDVVLDGVDLAPRTAERVDGRLSGVVVGDVEGGPIRLEGIRLGGGGDAITATTTIAREETERLLADALERGLGVRPTGVRIGAPDRVVVAIGPASAEGRFVVTDAGDLVIRVVSGPGEGDEVPVLRAGSDLPVRLTGVGVDEDGLRVTGRLTVGLLG